MATTRTRIRPRRKPSPKQRPKTVAPTNRSTRSETFSSWPFRLVVVIILSGILSMVLALISIIIPAPTSAVAPLRVSVVVNNTTSRHLVGATQHHLLVEALASASASIDQPLTYHFQGSSMVPVMMFGAGSDTTGSWEVSLNGKVITNLQDVVVQRGDRVIVTRIHPK